MKAATSLPRKFSPSPMPTTSGELRRAATTRQGSAASIATRVNAPSSRRQTFCIAVVRSTPDSTSRSRRWAATSVSVSEVISTPAASSSPRSVAKFSRMPLCTTATRPCEPMCGWALRSVGAPWVAQRVCPMPVVEDGSGFSASAFSRLASLPAFLSLTSDPRVDEGDPGGVVAAVLEPSQTLDDHALGLLLTDVPDDSAHGREVYRQGVTGRPGRSARAAVQQSPACPTSRRRPPAHPRAPRPRRTSSSSEPPGRRWPRPPRRSLTPDEIARLRGLGDALDLREIEQVYLPLSRLLSPVRRGRLAAAPRAGGVPAPRHAAAHAVRDRPRRVGRRRQVDDRARAAADAGPLARAPQRRARHDRRLPAPQRRARAARHPAPQGLPRVLRPQGAAEVRHRHQVRLATRSRPRPTPTSSTTSSRTRRSSSSAPTS